MSDTCECGHVLDEHSARNGTCEVDGCECACFEDDGREDDSDDHGGPDDYRDE